MRSSFSPEYRARVNPAWLSTRCSPRADGVTANRFPSTSDRCMRTCSSCCGPTGSARCGSRGGPAAHRATTAGQAQEALDRRGRGPARGERLCATAADRVRGDRARARRRRRPRRLVDIGLEALEPRLFSFDGPWGACPECTGLDSRREVDPELVVPDEEKSLSEGAVAPWTNTSGAEYFTRRLEAVAAAAGFSTAAPWRHLSATAKKVVLHGFREQVHLTCRRAALPGLRRRPAETGRARRHRGRTRHRRADGTAHRSTRAMCTAPGAGGLGAASRRRRRRGDRRATAVPSRRRPGPSVTEPARRPSVRRRGTADPAGHPDRRRSGRRAVRAGRTGSGATCPRSAAAPGRTRRRTQESSTGCGSTATATAPSRSRCASSRTSTCRVRCVTERSTTGRPWTYTSKAGPSPTYWA